MAVVCFVGLGAMGYPMASRLAGCQQVKVAYVWNRTQSTARKHARLFGTKAVWSLTDVAHKVDIFVSCLPTSKEVEDVVTSVLTCLKYGAVWVDATSGDPLHTVRISERLASRQVGMVDAPVSGGPRGATAGALSCMVGGAKHHVDQVKPILSAYTRVITHVGPVGSGHAVKAINNALNITNLLVVTEGLCALRKIGVDPTTALKAINQSSGRSLMSRIRAPEEVLTGRYGYGFKLGLMAKDVGIAQRLLDKSCPKAAAYVSLTQQRLRMAVDKYGWEADYTRAAELTQEQAGASLHLQAAPRSRL